MYHPTRGGVRGGRDQFNWEDVKNDKYRENFLGHSVMAPVGRWQKGKDLSWYAKDKRSAEEEKQRKMELQRVKEEEERLMAEALGLIPRTENVPEVGTGASRLEKGEVEQLFKKRGKDEEDDDFRKGERIEGIGFGARRLVASSFTAAHREEESVEAPTQIPESVPTSIPSAELADDSKKSEEGKSEKLKETSHGEEKRKKKSHAQKREERKLRKEKIEGVIKIGKKEMKRRMKRVKLEKKKERREARRKKEEEKDRGKKR